MILKKNLVAFFCFSYLNIFSQNFIEINDFKKCEGVQFYNMDVVNQKYYNDSNNTQIFFDVKEPTSLWIQYKTNTKYSYKYRTWLEIDISKILICTKDSIINLEDNWYDKNEKIYSQRFIMSYADETIDSLKISYIKNNVNFLSLYYFSHNMSVLSNKNYFDIYPLFDANKNYYKQFPLFNEVQNYAKRRYSKSKKCIYTGDSFINFNYFDIDSIYNNTSYINKEYLYLYITYPGCKPCKLSTPYLDSLNQKSNKNISNFISFSLIENKHYKIWRDNNRKYSWVNTTDFQGHTSDLLYLYNIQSYPTLLIFKNRKLINKFDDANAIRLLKDLDNPLSF